MPMLHVDHRAEVFDCAKGLNGDDVVDHDEGVGGMLKLAKMPVRRLRHKVTGLQGIYARVGVSADSRVWLKVLRPL